MRKWILFCLVVLSCQYTIANVRMPKSSLEELRAFSKEDEIEVMENLLQITVQQLENQKYIKHLMVEFLKQKKEFILGNQTKTHTAKMVKTARTLYEGLMSQNMQHLFSPAYMEELFYFSSIAGKNHLKRP